MIIIHILQGKAFAAKIIEKSKIWQWKHLQNRVSIKFIIVNYSVLPKIADFMFFQMLNENSFSYCL